MRTRLVHPLLAASAVCVLAAGVASVAHAAGSASHWPVRTGTPFVPARRCPSAPRYAGLASGFLNTGRQLGGAVGLAALVTVISAVTHHHSHNDAATPTLVGFRAAFVCCAATGLAAATISPLLPKTRRKPPTSPVRGDNARPRD